MAGNNVVTGNRVVIKRGILSEQMSGKIGDLEITKNGVIRLSRKKRVITK